MRVPVLKRRLVAPRLLALVCVVAAGAVGVRASGAAPAATPPSASVPTTSAPAPTTSAPTTAPPGPTASTTGAPTSTTGPPAAGGPGDPGAASGSTTTVAGPTTTSTTMPREIPKDEAELIALLDDVHSRLGDLATQIAKLGSEIDTNATALKAANDRLAATRAAAYAADRRVDASEVARSAARFTMRKRAVLAYIHQPTGDLANLFLHLSDPAELVTARSLYRTLVDAQVSAVKAFDRSDREARAAAGPADRAHEAAQREQASVAREQDLLQRLRETLVRIQGLSSQQLAEQNRLLGQLGTDKAKFEAELQAQAAQSASITQLLQSLNEPGDSAPPPTGGYFGNPVPGAPITQRFGPNRDPFTGAAGFHPGIDYSARSGTPIHAAGDATVVFTGEESGYGTFTCLNHGHNLATCYAHQTASLVSVGDQVKRGDVIGLVGSTGYSTGPHLHFEVRVNGSPVDPIPWLSGS